MLNGELVLAPSQQELNDALDAAEEQMCSTKLFCSRDGLFISPERWQAEALRYICLDKHSDWCDPARFGRDGNRVLIPASVGPALYEESGIGSAIKAVLPQALRGGFNSGKNVSVYLGIRDGKAVYAGITNNIGRRTARHGSRFDFLQEVTRVTVTRGEARAIEQALIRRNPQFENVRNSISPLHPYQRRAVDWGEAWLRANGL